MRIITMGGTDVHISTGRIFVKLIIGYRKIKTCNVKCLPQNILDVVSCNI